jgi:OmpA-OmpF porin, OOP family
MRGIWRARLALSPCLALGLWSTSSGAAEGFNLNRFEPAEPGSRWLVADSLSFEGHERWAFGVVSDWGHKPLVTYDGNGAESVSIVEDQLFFRLGASISLWERARVGLSVPMLVYQNGDDAVAGETGFAGGQQSAFGDARVAADYRVFGEEGQVLSGAVGLRLYLPTGNPEAYASDGSVSVEPRFAVAGAVARFFYAGHAGVRARPDHGSSSAAFGTEAVLGAAAGMTFLDDKLLVGPELWTSTVISRGGDGFFGKAATPFEVQLGGHYDVRPEWRVGLGIGPGLTSGVGSPAARWVASLAWVPGEFEPELPVDADADGIVDMDDACPQAPGVFDPDPRRNGCPAAPVVTDVDGDGVVDEQDACPREAGVVDAVNSARNGCPPLSDRDGDGAADPADRCPDEPGVLEGVAADRFGCPLARDADADGVLDADDLCPSEAAGERPDPERKGCPRAQLAGDKIVISDRIQFENEQARLTPESEVVLEAVARVLANHPEITRLRIEGHTNHFGAAEYNRGLSKRRAAAVLNWLVAHGIARDRLESDGFGSDQPLNANATQAQRLENRRVEFRVLEIGGRPAASLDSAQP